MIRKILILIAYDINIEWDDRIWFHQHLASAKSVVTRLFFSMVNGSIISQGQSYTMFHTGPPAT